MKVKTLPSRKLEYLHNTFMKSPVAAERFMKCQSSGLFSMATTHLFASINTLAKSLRKRMLNLIIVWWLRGL